MYQDKLANEDKNKRLGLIVSFFIHFLIIFLMIFVKWSYLDPPPTAPGIVMNISFQENSELNSNKQSNTNQTSNPSPPSLQEFEKKSIATIQKESQIAVEEKPSNKTSVAQAKVVTDDPSPVIAEKKIEPSPQEIENRRLQKLEEDRRRIEAEEQAKRDQEKKRFEESKSKFGSLFEKNTDNTNTNNTENNEGSSNAEALEDLSKRSDKIGGDLSSRGVLYEPEITDNSQKSGKVVVKVCVDKSGNVVSATYTQKGSTTTDQVLINIAVSGTQQYRFTSTDISRQCGTVTIDFKLK